MIMRTAVELQAFLDGLGIPYEKTEHPAVFTVDESSRLVPPLPGAKTKNLFLRDQKGHRHFLVVVGHDTGVDLKALAPVLGTSKVSFGSPDRLMARLGVEPGAVSLFALVNDPDRQVELFVDRALWRADALQCHPLENTATIVMARPEVERFLQATGHRANVVDVPRRGE
jgi:Ala-tRNA(Pro) deacylase